MRALAVRRPRSVACLLLLMVLACSTPGGAPDAGTDPADAAASRDVGAVDASALDAFVPPNDGAALDTHVDANAASIDACVACGDAGPTPCGAPASTCTLPGGSPGICDGGHVCVACLTNAECTAAGLHCDGRSHTCAGEDVVLVTLRRGSTDVVGAQYAGPRGPRRRWWAPPRRTST